MAGVWLRVSAWLRAHAARTIPVVLVVGLAAGAALALAVGSRRTESAPDRFTANYGGEPDLLLYQTYGEPLVDEVAALDGVELAQGVTFVSAFPKDRNGRVVMDVDPFAGDDDLPGTRVVEGRFTNPDAPDEFTVNVEAARLFDAEVGQKYTIVSYTQDQTDASQFGEEVPLSGPTFEATLVGIVSSPTNFDDPSEQITYSKAFLTEYADVGVVASIFLARTSTSPDDVVQEIRRLPAGDGVFELPPQMITESSRDAVSLQATSLWIVTAIALVAALLVAAQVVSRHLRSTSGDRTPLVALGYRPRQIAIEAGIQGAMIATVASVVAVVVATLGSAFFPLGTIRAFEPDPGPRVDLPVLLLGAVGLVAVVGVATAASAARSSAVASKRMRPVLAADRVAAAGGPPGMVHGIRYALSRNVRRGLPPVALVAGTAASVAGLVGALVVATSMNRVVDDPPRWGANFDASYGNEFVAASFDLVAPALADPDLEEITAATIGSLTIDGQDVPVWAYEPVRGSILPVITSGRAPTRDADIALGARVARQIGRELGDTVTVESVDGSVSELEIVGISVTPHEAGDGATLPYATYARLAPGATRNLLVVRFADEAGDDGSNRIFELTETSDSSLTIPSGVRALERVTTAPYLLALVLVVLAAALLMHNLIASTRDRARDLAVMRALGADRRHLRSILHWQSTTVAILALLIGIPFGLAGGARVFSLVARDIGVVDSADLAPVVVSAVAIGVLAVANLAAAWPARRAVRVQPMVVLRRS